MAAENIEEEMRTLTAQRKKREEQCKQLFQDGRSPRERLSLLGDVLNSLIDEHNATTEVYAMIPATRHIQVSLKDLAAVDAWWNGGDIEELLKHFSPRTPYDPGMICGCLPRRPETPTAA